MATKINAEDMHFRILNEQIRASADKEVIIENTMGQRFIGSGCIGKDIRIHGIPGNALGAYLTQSDITVYGNAQDATGDTMNDGVITIHGNCGDAPGYGMRDGKILIKGSAGYRAGIHMKQYMEKVPVVMIGGKVGDFLAEYQAGGRIIVLGLGFEGKCPVGSFCGTGMHGGAIYIRSDIAPTGLPAQVVISDATDADKEEIRADVELFTSKFGGNADEILSAHFFKLVPNTKNPYKQLYVNN
ncbi:MAG: glutamate synthase [Huintestinicola sp.]